MIVKMSKKLTRCERESVIAKLAKLLLGISKPLKETFLVDVLDRAGADAGVEQGTIRTAFASTNPTNVCK
jgi:hypothetical protein